MKVKRAEQYFVMKLPPLFKLHWSWSSSERILIISRGWNIIDGIYSCTHSKKCLCNSCALTESEGPQSPDCLTGKDCALKHTFSGVDIIMIWTHLCLITSSFVEFQVIRRKQVIKINGLVISSPAFHFIWNTTHFEKLSGTNQQL